MAPETIQQFQQIVATLKRVIDASGELADKVDGLELRFNDTLEALTTIHTDLQTLLKTYESQASFQSAMNTELANAVARLEARIAVLEGQGHGHGQVM